MTDFMADSESTAYGYTHMKARLKEHFGDQILITEALQKPYFKTFMLVKRIILKKKRNTSSKLLQNSSRMTLSW